MLARKPTLHRPPKQANPFTSIRLQPLCPPQKSQPQSNQHLPASFSKMPGWGGHPGCSYGTPGVGGTRFPYLCVGSALSAPRRYQFPSNLRAFGFLWFFNPAARCLCASVANPNLRHSIHTHSDRPSYSSEPFGKESRQNLCGTMRLMRLCRTKPKIPIVAIFAPERAD